MLECKRTKEGSQKLTPASGVELNLGVVDLTG